MRRRVLGHRLDATQPTWAIVTSASFKVQLPNRVANVPFVFQPQPTLLSIHLLTSPPLITFALSSPLTGRRNYTTSILAGSFTYQDRSPRARHPHSFSVCFVAQALARRRSQRLVVRFHLRACLPVQAIVESGNPSRRVTRSPTYPTLPLPFTSHRSFPTQPTYQA